MINSLGEFVMSVRKAWTIERFIVKTKARAGENPQIVIRVFANGKVLYESFPLNKKRASARLIKHYHVRKNGLRTNSKEAQEQLYLKCFYEVHKAFIKLKVAFPSTKIEFPAMEFEEVSGLSVGYMLTQIKERQNELAW